MRRLSQQAELKQRIYKLTRFLSGEPDRNQGKQKFELLSLIYPSSEKTATLDTRVMKLSFHGKISRPHQVCGNVVYVAMIDGGYLLWGVGLTSLDGHG